MLTAIPSAELRVDATRGHPYKHFNSSTVRCTFFADEVVNTRIKLPHPGVDFNSLTSFKKTLKILTSLSFSFDFSFDFIVDIVLLLFIIGIILYATFSIVLFVFQR